MFYKRYELKKKFGNLEEALKEISKVTYLAGYHSFKKILKCKNLKDLKKAYKANGKFKKDPLDWYIPRGNLGLILRVDDVSCIPLSDPGQYLDIRRNRNGSYTVELSLDSDEVACYDPVVRKCVLRGWELQNNDVDWAELYWHNRKIDRETKVSLKQDPTLCMHFGVYFEEIHGEWHVLSHVLRVDPEEDIYRISLVPEYAAHFRALAEKELDRVFVVPDEYEYNELTRKGGENSFYAQKFREYQTGLRKLIAVCEELEKSTPQVEVQLTEPKPKRAPRKPRAERSRS